MTARRIRRRPLRGDDSGAVLVLALIVITVVALVAGSMLNLNWSSLSTTTAVRYVAGTSSTADAAAQAAINDLRLHTFDNDTSSSSYPNCFGTTGTTGTADGGRTLVASAVVPGAPGAAANSAAVRCDADPATGASGGVVPISAANKPGNAILTLSTNPLEDGINVKANSTTIPFNVHGGVVSNSDIAVVNGSLQVNSGVFARTGCTGTINSTPPPSCSVAGALPSDPNYAPETTTVPTYRAVPTSCSSTTTFQPGYYDDAKALSDLMGLNSCKNTVWWFKPGTYYFDFQNTVKSSASQNTHQWTVGVGQLVAGTPVDGSGGTIAQPLRPATVPGSCANPIHDVTAVGVQFIFGGDSQLQVADQADAEICGTYHTSRPPLAVYGLKSGTASPTTLTGRSATTVTGAVTHSVPADTATGFTPTPGQTLAGSVSATSDAKAVTFAPPVADKGSSTATLDLSGAIASGIPAGTRLSSAKVRIVYGTSSAATARSVKLTPVSASGPGTTVSPATPVSLAAQVGGTTPPPTQTFDVTTNLQQAVHDQGLTDLKVAYSTTLAPGGSEQVDAVLLDLTYTVPSWRGETTAAVPGNCLAIPYTQGSAGTGKCAVIYTATNYKGAFYIQGTTYTPAAAIDIALSNITAQVLRFGVIARALDLWETGAVSYQGPVIEIPDNSPGYGIGDTVVHLSVTVCPGASTCAYDPSNVSLRARVYIHDPTGGPVAGSRQMAVQSWAVLR